MLSRGEREALWNNRGSDGDEGAVGNPEATCHPLSPLSLMPGILFLSRFSQNSSGEKAETCVT